MSWNPYDIAPIAGYLAEFGLGALPTQPSKPGLSKVAVLNLQVALNALGEKLVQDGLFGPGTKNAWTRQSNARKLDPVYDRASSNEAWVNQTTWETLLGASMKTMSAATPSSTTVAPTQAKATAGKPTSPSRPGLTKISVGTAQDILNRLGAKLKRDGLFGPGTASAWGTAARAKGTPVEFDRAGPNDAWVDAATQAALSASQPAPGVSSTKPTPAASSTKPTSPSRPGLTKISVGTAQDILNRLGAKLKRDGLFGPGTASAWGTAARAKGTPVEFDRAGPNDAWVDAATQAALSASQPAPGVSSTKPTPAASSTKPTSPSRPGLTKISVGTAQDILNRLGAKLKRDGLFGPGTASAWGTAARAKGTPVEFDRAGPNDAWVDAATQAALSASQPAPGVSSTKPTPAASSTKPTSPSRPGLTKISVGTAQDILNKRGAKLKRDGLYGPSTQMAWGTTATANGLSPEFDRAGPSEAWVDPKTQASLSSSASSTTAVVPPSAVSKAPKTGAVVILVSDAQDVLNNLGAKLKKDGLFGPNTAAAWTRAANTKKVDGLFSRETGQTAWVMPATVAALKQNTAPSASATQTPEQLAASKLVEQAKTPISILTLQQAQLMADQTPARKGQFAGVKASGLWDAATDEGFYKLFQIVAPYAAVWKLALPRLVDKVKNVVNLTQQQASDATQLSKMYIAQSTAPATNTQAAPGKTPAKSKTDYVAKVVASADTVTSVKMVQQALREIYELQQSGKVPKSPIIPKVAVTGKWNPKTDDDALFLAWGDAIYPYAKVIPTSDRNAILAKLLSKTTGKNGLSGASTKAAGPSYEGANAMRLPAKVAKQAQSLASNYITRTTGSASKPSDTQIVPMPPAGGTVVMDPTLITGGVPSTAVPVNSALHPEPEPIQLSPSPNTSTSPTPATDSAPPAVVLNPSTPQMTTPAKSNTWLWLGLVAVGAGGLYFATKSPEKTT